METLLVMTPATGQLIQEVPAADAGLATAALERARTAQPAWAAMPFRDRARILRRLARALRDDATVLDTLCAESGKPRYEAESIEVFYTLELTRYYTGRAGRRALADDVRRPFVFTNKRARVVHHARGVVAVIGPWNWPLLNNYGDCVGPLTAGNAVVLKPSEHTPLTSLRIAALARDAGGPEGGFQVRPGRGAAGVYEARPVARRGGGRPRGPADMLFSTGSAATGKQVAQPPAARLVPAVL